tara:strand:- start:44 stop:487 length:444 start_codon:yes stop_codon:yes gene_type:complete
MSLLTTPSASTEIAGLGSAMVSNRLNLKIVKNAIELLQKLSKMQEDFLSLNEFNPASDVLDNEGLQFVASNLGFAIDPAHTYAALLEKGTDFSVGDLTTAFRNIERLSNAERCKDIFSVFSHAESAWKHLGDHNGEITAKVLPLLAA